MKKPINYLYLFWVIFCFFIIDSQVFAQGSSNKGTDFWLGYGNHVTTGSMVLYLTSDVNTKATVTIPNLGFSQTVDITANVVQFVDIPTTAHLTTEGKSLNGIHLTSLKPIIAYAHIYQSSVSGATLVLPVNTLGKDYYSINYKQISNSSNCSSWFFIVAVEDNTQVEITPSQKTLGGWDANSTNIVSLNKGEIYNVMGTFTNAGGSSSGVDLTGSKIKSISTNGSCKKIAVFSGSSKIAINCLSYVLPGSGTPNPGSADNLFQQVYPTATWGKNFITVPQLDRDFVIYRILKSDPAAVVTLNGTVIDPKDFINNFYYEFASKQTDIISSDKPIQTVQYAVTQNKTLLCNNVTGDIGDPEMIFLNPLEQTLNKITMYSTPRAIITKHFINVVVKNEGVSTFKLDGINVASNFIPVPGSSTHSYSQLRVSEGTHNLISDFGFNAIAYGFGSFDSYGYAAGANLTAFGVEPIDQLSNEVVQTGCVGNAYRITLKLPYKPVDINLDKGDGNGSKPITLQLISQSTNANGETTYTYLLVKDLIFTQPNTYNFTANVIKPTIDACGTGDEFSFDLIINNKPVAGFTAPVQSCLNSEVSFTHQTDPDEASVTDYLWDFNGEGSSTVKDPKFVFKSIGIKKVKFSSKYNTGCWSDVVSKDIQIVALPLAKFTTVSPNCELNPLQFTDQSTTANGVINNWNWNFGDPTSSNNSSSLQNPSHIFSTAKTYNVTLTVTTDLGCTQTIVQPITILPTPVANFITPNVCLDDAFAQFTNTTTFSENTVLSYKWDFGDPTSTSNTSTLKNPLHKYLAAADYKVKLTVTSAAGCVAEIEKVFTVNGSTPKSAFIVQNDTKLCSNQIISFEDHSTIDFGQITRIDWYFDDLKPTEFITDNEPGKRPLNSGDIAKIYTHEYPIFYSPAKRDIIVKMVTYSGSSLTCISTITKTITLNASPKVEFNALAPVCQNANPFQIIASETTGLIGKGKFSGAGIDENGIFSPILAGVGTHTLTYIYQTDAGCSDTKSQDIVVYSVPVVNAGIDHTILIGASVQLVGESVGENLTYKWSPSIGLDHDDILNPIATPIKDTYYKLTVTNSNQCQVFDEAYVKVLEYPEVPNTFTPNGDGVNDTWSIKHLDRYPSSTIKIFNREGRYVFNANRYTEPWDGRYNGVDLPIGTYYYIITALDGSLSYTGSVLLVR